MPSSIGESLTQQWNFPGLISQFHHLLTSLFSIQLFLKHINYVVASAASQVSNIPANQLMFHNFVFEPQEGPTSSPSGLQTWFHLADGLDDDNSR